MSTNYYTDKAKTQMVKILDANSYIQVTVRTAAMGYELTDVSYRKISLVPEELKKQKEYFEKEMLRAVELEFIVLCEKYTQFSDILKKNISKKQP